MFDIPNFALNLICMVVKMLSSGFLFNLSNLKKQFTSFSTETIFFLMRAELGNFPSDFSHFLKQTAYKVD